MSMHSWFARGFVGSITLMAATVVAVTQPASAITRRHDRDDSQYISRANTDFPQAGYVSGPGWIGSGTLISPTWVLTAGHVADPSATTFVSPAGSASITNKYAYGVGDIGLVQLATPITSQDPIRLYDVGLFGIEDGQDAMIAGAGSAGTGLTGQLGGTAGTFRAAETYVYANADAWGWGSNQLLTWFRSPTGGAADLEGGSAQGDSGGGLFLNVGGQWSIAGVLSQAWWGGGGGDTIGKYDTGGVFVRSGTDPLLDWILSYATDAQVVPEPAGLTTVLVLATGLLRRRRRAA